MSVRGSRSRGNSHRPLAPPPQPADGPDARFEPAASARADAKALVEADGDRAYWQARDRQARAREAAAHWDRVARLIARASDEESGASSATSGGSSARPAGRRDTVQIEELKRVLGARPGRFRLQFFAVAATEHGPSVLSEVDVEARDATSAIRAAAERGMAAACDRYAHHRSGRPRGLRGAEGGPPLAPIGLRQRAGAGCRRLT